MIFIVAIIQKIDKYISIFCHKDKCCFILVHKSVSKSGEQISRIWLMILRNVSCQFRI